MATKRRRILVAQSMRAMQGPVTNSGEVVQENLTVRCCVGARNRPYF